MAEAHSRQSRIKWNRKIRKWSTNIHIKNYDLIKNVWVEWPIAFERTHMSKDAAQSFVRDSVEYSYDGQRKVAKNKKHASKAEREILSIWYHSTITQIKSTTAAAGIGIYAFMGARKTISAF